MKDLPGLEWTCGWLKVFGKKVAGGSTILLCLIGLGCNGSDGRDTTTSLHVTSNNTAQNKNKVSILNEDAPTAVTLPEHWWWYGAQVNMLYVLGMPSFGDPGITTDLCRQYRLSDDQYAFGMYSPLYATSVILVYRATSDQLRSDQGAHVSTDRKSLTAWLLRHAPTVPMTKVIGAWAKLLVDGPDHLPGQTEIFELVGEVAIRHNIKGLLAEARFSLQTNGVLPLFQTWIESNKKAIREEIKHEQQVGRQGNTPPNALPAIEQRLEELRKWELMPEPIRQELARDPMALGPARITGRMLGQWKNEKPLIPTLVPF